MYVPGIFHGVRFVENERHADRHEGFWMIVFCFGFFVERFLLGGGVMCFRTTVFCCSFLVMRFRMNVLPNRERIA